MTLSAAAPYFASPLTWLRWMNSSCMHAKTASLPAHRAPQVTCMHAEGHEL